MRPLLMPLLLPNKKHIDERGLEEAFLDLDASRTYYLDTHTGSVCLRDAQTDKATIKEYETNDRYSIIPRVPAGTQIKWMRWMKDNVMGVMDAHDFETIEAFEKIDRDTSFKNDLEKFNALLTMLESKTGHGWHHGWAQGRVDFVWEEAIDDWLDSLPIVIEDKFEGCEGCPACKLFEEQYNNQGDALEAKQKEAKKRKKGQQE